MNPEYLIGFLILVIFAIGASLMFTRTLPALLVLPLMGISIASGTAILLWGVSLRPDWFPSKANSELIEAHDILGGVISEGALRLHELMIVAFFGGILSFIMQKSGVAESLVKNAAELIGDNPFAVSLFSMGLIAVLFTSIGGLGAIIMVAMVVLPMLATVGVPPAAAGGIMLIGISLGGIMNPGNWVAYKDVLGVPEDSVRQFAMIVFLITAMAGVIFICVELFRAGATKAYVPMIATVLGLAVVGTGVIYANIPDTAPDSESIAAADSANPPTSSGASPSLPQTGADDGDQKIEGNWLTRQYLTQIRRAYEWGAVGKVLHLFPIRWALEHPVKFVVGLFFFILIVSHLLELRSRARRWRHQVVTIPWYSYLIPIVPLLLILVYGVPILAAFLLGFVYAVFVTARPGSISLTIQSMIQGASSVMPAILLMVGIGILMKAVLGPSTWTASHPGVEWPVLAATRPIFGTIIPRNPFTYVLLFGLAAPLALYRGPLNLWGLGCGVVALLLASGQVPAAAIMAMMMSVGQVQGICDPTNTQNVWLANELRVDVQALMWRTLPYIWGMVFVGLAIAALLYAPAWREIEEKRALQQSTEAVEVTQ